MARMPSLFVSHGSPMIMLEPSPARDFLASFASTIARPKAILIASAHFESDEPLLSVDAAPDMIYDFGGFPQPLFEMSYKAPGSPELAQKAGGLLGAAGIMAYGAQNRGFDHGTWVPLKLMYPEADIPVVQISVQPKLGSAHHIAMGRALAPLRDEGVLIIGSGSLTHNLYEMMRLGRIKDAAMTAPVAAFSNWIAEKVAAGDSNALGNYRTDAPFAKENHPTDEHFLPLPFAFGAGGGVAGQRVHQSVEYGVLAMDAYLFE